MCTGDGPPNKQTKMFAMCTGDEWDDSKIINNKQEKEPKPKITKKEKHYKGKNKTN